MKGIVIQYGCSIFLTLMCGINSFSSVWPSYAINMLQADDSPLGYKISQNVATMIGSVPMLGSLVATIVAGHVADGIGRKKSMILSGLLYTLEIVVDSPLGYKISQNVATMIGSVLMLGSSVATIVAGHVADDIGRKRSMILRGLLYTVAWSILVAARGNIQILFARFLIGIASGITCVVILIYISEITELSIRGSTACLLSLLYNVGIMASYLQGWFCSYNVICYTNLSFLVVYVILMCFLKDTPSYLLKIGNDKEALKSLKFYRGQTESTADILEELSYIKQHLNSENNDTESGTLSEKEKLQKDENGKSKKEKEEYAKSSNESKNGWVLLFTVPHNRRAITSSLVFVVLVGSMGMVAVQTYASQFFMRAAPGWSPDLCSVIFSFILVLSNLLTVLVTDLFPRRTLMISNCFLTTLCLATLGCSMRWPATPTWVALLAVLLFCLVFHLGVINIVFVQLSECYGPKVNGPAAVTVFGAMFLANFVVLALFVPAVDTIGIDNTFFVFTAIAGFTTVLAYYWIQETRRVPLEEIQRIYDQGIMYRSVAVIEK